MYASSEEQSRPQLVVVECGCVGVGSGECMLAFYISGARRKTLCCLLTCTLRRGRRENERLEGARPCLGDSSACAGVAPSASGTV